MQIDGMATVTINCAGINPANTSLLEIVEAINDALGEVMATHDGHVITLTSPTRGSGSEIILGIPPEEDATEEIFGIGPRLFSGKPAAGETVH